MFHHQLKSECEYRNLLGKTERNSCPEGEDQIPDMKNKTTDLQKRFSSQTWHISYTKGRAAFGEEGS